MNDTSTPRTDEMLRKYVEEKTPSGRFAYNPMDIFNDVKELERELTSAQQEIENLSAAGIHSCSDICQRPNCVLRREIKVVTEQLKNIQAELLRSCLREQLHHEDYKYQKERADDAGFMLIEVTEQRDRLAEAIRLTLMENLDLCDGDICTLKRLKDAVGFDLENAIGETRRDKTPPRQ
jgi:hypothetical protein